MIRNQDITFIVQGPDLLNGKPVGDNCIRSIQQFFPGSKIIYPSVAKRTNCSYSIFVKDPGAIQAENGKLNNVNRQIHSTSLGLAHVETGYACKIRSDNFFTKTIDFGSIYKRYKSLNHQELIAFDTTTKCMSVPNFSYHICDWFYFGKTESLKRMFDGHLFQGQEYANIAPEVLLTTKFLGISADQVNVDINFEQEAHEIFSNFLLVDRRTIGIRSSKRGYQIRFFGRNTKFGYGAESYLEDREKFLSTKALRIKNHRYRPYVSALFYTIIAQSILTLNAAKVLLRRK